MSVNDNSQSNHISVKIKSPTQVLDFSVRNGIAFQGLCAKHKTPIEFSCREGDCGICCIRVIRGAENLSEPTKIEKDFLQAMRADPDERLACQTRILGPVEIEADYL
ncbi:MAG: 2Fe-2S iron-sulfur cluster-binding protein [Proteobacteria bacterium]|nr:2Fe-2S iron-sulfur cluster-binding protein [Pseudomonadota bacterium]